MSHIGVLKHIDGMTSKRTLYYIFIATLMMIYAGAMSSCDIYEEIDEETVVETLPDTAIIVGGEGQMMLVKDDGDTTATDGIGYFFDDGFESFYLLTSDEQRCIFDSSGYVSAFDSLELGAFEILLLDDGSDSLSYIGFISVETSNGLQLAVVADALDFIDPETGEPYDIPSTLEITELTAELIRGRLTGTFFIFDDPLMGGPQSGFELGTFSIEFAVPLQGSC